MAIVLEKWRTTFRGLAEDTDEWDPAGLDPDVINGDAADLCEQLTDDLINQCHNGDHKAITELLNVFLWDLEHLVRSYRVKHYDDEVYRGLATQLTETFADNALNEITETRASITETVLSEARSEALALQNRHLRPMPLRKGIDPPDPTPSAEEQALIAEDRAVRADRIAHTFNAATPHTSPAALLREIEREHRHAAQEVVTSLAGTKYIQWGDYSTLLVATLARLQPKHRSTMVLLLTKEDLSDERRRRLDRPDLTRGGYRSHIRYSRRAFIAALLLEVGAISPRHDEQLLEKIIWKMLHSTQNQFWGSKRHELKKRIRTAVRSLFT